MRSTCPRPLSALILTAVAVVFLSVTEAAARPQRAPAPVFGRSIVVIPVSGRVLVAPRGGGARRPLRRALAVPSGSLIDVSAGAHAVIETATPHGATKHTADLTGGVVRVIQARSAKGRTDIVLSGRVPACDVAQTARVLGPVRVTVPAHHRRRHAVAARSSSVGQFRLVGKNGSALNNAAASYEGTEDCHGTTVTDRSGHVSARASRSPSSQSLGPGETWLIRCSSGAASTGTGSYCVSVLGTNDFHGFVDYTTGLFAKTNSSTYNLCQTTPGQSQFCQTWALTTADSDGYKEGLVGCSVAQAGTYSLSWRIGGTTLGAPLSYRSPIVAQPVYPCNGTAGTPYKTGSYVLPLRSGIKIVNSYTLPTAAWLTFLTVDLAGQGSGTESLSAVVYQDEAGHPGRLIASTQPCVVSGSDTSDCDDNGFIFSPNINVPAGTYWFGLLTSGKSDVAEVQEGHTALAFTNDNPLSAASDPFGAATSAERRMSLQVNYTINPPAGSSPPASPTSG